MDVTPILLRRAVVALPPTQGKGATLRVMQMNVLADRLAPPSAFPHTDPAVLPWSHRKDLLLSQIVSLDPDVVCLEEVDHYDDHFRPALAGLGYEGFFKLKNGESDADGCALFFKTAKFELVAHKGIDFEGHTQVAQIVRLRFRQQPADAAPSTNSEGGEGQQPRDVCVAVTHLKAKEGFEEKRLEEGILLLRSALAFVGGEEHVKDAPLLVLGDFNDVPSSLVCRYFRSELPLPELHASVPPHPFRLRSAYAHHPPNDEIKVNKSENGGKKNEDCEENEGRGEDADEKEPYSTYKKRETEVRRTIDYIWYPADAMVPVALLEVPPVSALPVRLPSHNHPSDHLALCADLAWL